MKSDTKSLPFRRFIQLYSRNSGRHVRIKADRSVDAIGEDGDKYGTSSKTAMLLCNYIVKTCLHWSLLLICRLSLCLL